jgi:hypothetical protein
MGTTRYAAHAASERESEGQQVTSETMKQYDGKSDGKDEPAGGDAGKAVLVGLLGGIVSAAGYLVYQRLPEDQKQRIQTQVRSLVETRLNEIRQNFNI